jgi:hypothetical protein
MIELQRVNIVRETQLFVRARVVVDVALIRIDGLYSQHAKEPRSGNEIDASYDSARAFTGKK